MICRKINTYNNTLRRGILKPRRYISSAETVILRHTVAWVIIGESLVAKSIFISK
jgi:hypothetical protein